MVRLIAPKRFQKKLRLFLIKRPELERVFVTQLHILQNNPHDTRLKTHRLSGKLKKFFACTITYEYRLIFYRERDEITLLAIGTHDEVY